MIRSLAWLAGALVAVLPVAAKAGFPVEVEVTCPIDGRAFSFTTTGSYSIFGIRPDGKPYGSWEFPISMPVCPDNGFVMYRDEYSAEELARLRPLVASADYRSLGAETTHYRAYWLMQHMGEPLPDQLWMLVQATWEAEADPLQRRLYFEQLIAREPELGPPRDGIGLALRARAINALRELGRFEDAAALLAATDPEAAGQLSEQERSRSDWPRHYRTLSRLIARRDMSVEPVAMIPQEIRQARCESAERLSAHDREDCAAFAAQRARRRSVEGAE